MSADIGPLLYPLPYEACGVFGVMGESAGSALTALGLHALQHRGQQAAGIVSCQEGVFYSYRGVGKVDRHFSCSSVIDGLPGQAAIGHVRYATHGALTQDNIQPLEGQFDFGRFALSHNGNLTNADQLRGELTAAGARFRSSVDTEVILQLMQTCSGSVVERLLQTLPKLEGAFSLVALTGDQLIGIRDPLGIRPLVLGSTGKALVLASETCALDIIGAELKREVEPGELVAIGCDGQIGSYQLGAKKIQKFCVFEYIYFARPDSIVQGHSVYGVRQRLGRELAREAGVEADMVVPVPDSGVPAALGYASESGVPFELGIVRNHYIGRTFIEPTQDERNLGVKLKHNANRAVLAGKRVVLIDDSIVRGTTARKIVELVRESGAERVHVRISSPVTRHPCFLGIATPEQRDLLGHDKSVRDMANYIRADSLAFLSLDGVYRAVADNGQRRTYCDACFTGNYPQGDVT